MVLITLRTADEVRPAQFSETAAELDADMVAIAGSIIERHIGAFDPAAFVDRYQQALRELVEAKLHGRAVEPVQAPEPSTVIDLMAALKRSLAAETGAPGGAGVAKRRPRSAGERRQSSLLLPVNGGRAARPKQSAGSAAVKKRRA
jgi:DNA end-binding protein Ku